MVDFDGYTHTSQNFYGGDGIDSVTYASFPLSISVLFGAAGSATVIKTAAGTDTLTSIEIVYGTAYNDGFRSTTSPGRFIGLAGNDTFTGGADVALDTADYSFDHLREATHGIFVNLRSVAQGGVNPDSVIDSFGFTDTLSNIRNVTGSQLDDVFLGGENPNVFKGGEGKDTVSGFQGDDTLYGDNGDDVINGEDDNDFLNGGSGVDALRGGAGLDTADYAEKTAAVVVFLDGANDATVTVDGVAEDTVREIENVNGGSGNDSLVGDGGANVLNGAGGGDFLFANRFNADGSMMLPGAGNDTMNGGDGNDGLFAGNGADTLDGGAGDDGIVGGQGNDTLSGGSGVDFLFGGFFSAGAFAVGSGDDTLSGGDDGDKLYGFDGDDAINGDAGDDYVEAGAGADTMNGGAGNDFLLGQDDNDIIAGGAGFDYEYGGAGADTFVYKRGDSGDWVLDFTAAEGDRLRLEGFGFTSLASIPFVDLSSGSNLAVQLTVRNPADDSFDQLTIFGVSLAQLSATNVIVA